MSIIFVSIVGSNSRLLSKLGNRFGNLERSPLKNLSSPKTSLIISRMEKGSVVQPSSGLSSSVNGGGSDTRGSITSNGVVHFPLTPSSSLKIQKGDITKWFINGASDAIVNAANMRMLGGGGVDGAIHRAAGSELRAACYDIPEVRPGVRCPTGEARITLAFRLPVSHVIHTVGPVYDVDDHPEVSLRNSYRSCLRIAKENGIQYVAFPAISCGVYGYPFKEAATIAISTVREFVDDFKEVHFVLFSEDIYSAWLEMANELL